MIRNKPEKEGDTGWIFYGGGETQEYLDNPDNISIMSLNTVANLDPDIIGFVTYPPGTEIERNFSGKLEVITKEVKSPDVRFMLPVDTGLMSIMDIWQFEISERMTRRYDNGSLVVWKPGFTIWINSHSETVKPVSDRIKAILGTMSTDGYDLQRSQDDCIRKIRYQLEEDRDGAVQSSMHIFGITEDQDIHISIYYDSPKHKQEIEKIWGSLQCR